MEIGDLDQRVGEGGVPIQQGEKKLDTGRLVQKKLIPLTGLRLISTIVIQEHIREAVTIFHDAKDIKKYEECVQLLADEGDW